MLNQAFTTPQSKSPECHILRGVEFESRSRFFRCSGVGVGVGKFRISEVGVRVGIGKNKSDFTTLVIICDVLMLMIFKRFMAAERLMFAK